MKTGTESYRPDHSTAMFEAATAVCNLEVETVNNGFQWIQQRVSQQVAGKCGHKFRVVSLINCLVSWLLRVLVTCALIHSTTVTAEATHNLSYDLRMVEPEAQLLLG